MLSYVRIFIVFCIPLTFSGVTATGGAADELPRSVHLSAIDNEQTHSAAIKILTEAYNRLGIRVSVSLLPGIRSLVAANDGTTDGDVARIPGTEKKFENLLPVPTPIINFKGVAFTKSVEKPINTWEDLEAFQIGVIRGVRYSEINTRHFNRLLSNDMTHLFLLLEKGRIQVAVAVLEAGLAEIQNSFPNSGMRVAGDPLFSSPLYHFVNKKNAFLIPKLDAVIKDMKNSGRLKEIYNSAYFHPNNN